MPDRASFSLPRVPELETQSLLSWKRRRGIAAWLISVGLTGGLGTGIAALQEAAGGPGQPLATETLHIVEVELGVDAGLPEPVSEAPAGPARVVEGLDLDIPEFVPEQPPQEFPAGPIPAPAGSDHPVLGIPGALPGPGPLGASGSGSGGGLETEVEPPRFDANYLRNPAPEYPSLSRRLREEGRVLLRILVSADGRPLEVELRHSSGSPRLDRAAHEVVERWRFQPAKRGHETVAAWVLVPIVFTLEA